MVRIASSFKRIFWASAGTLTLSTMSFVEIALADEFIVKLKDTEGFQASVQALGTQKNLAVLDYHKVGGLVKIDLPSKDKHALARQLANLMRQKNVQYVVPNIKMHMFGSPDDPRFAEQWALAKVKAAEAWEHGTGRRETVVAVIDTGVDHKHEDLAANIWINGDEIAGNSIDDDGNGYVDDVNGWDFRDNDNDPMDLTSQQNPGHGTHCSGIIGAVGNNTKGVSGMSQVVSIMPVRFLGADGSGDLMSGAKAIDYAVKNGAQVISASWGATAPESAAQPILEAIGRANSAGVIFVAAAANDGRSNDKTSVFPANAKFPNMITVAASGNDDTKPEWSNFGIATVHLSSPGLNILSTLPDNKYGNLSGTSMATPLVAGLVALVLSTSQEKIDGFTMRSILQASGTQVAIETACQCRIDAQAAVERVINDKLTVVPDSLTVVPNGTATFKAFGGKAPFTFASSNAATGTIDANGNFSAKAEGDTKISITDSTGAVASSHLIRVAVETPQEEVCPLGDQMLCLLMCLFDPNLPWCQALPIP